MYLAIKRCREFRNQRNHGGCSSLEAESERDDRGALGVVAQYNMFDCAVGQFHKFGASRQVIICATAGKNHKNTREKLDEPLANTKAMQKPRPDRDQQSEAAVRQSLASHTCFLF
jgi:hypothetical protein